MITRDEGRDSTDKKLRDMNPSLSVCEAYYDTNRIAIDLELADWRAQRPAGIQNRQCSRSEVQKLMSYNHLGLFYSLFVGGLVTCPSSTKCSLFRVREWPDGGDDVMLRALLVSPAPLQSAESHRVG
eukprot:CAMPEP_0204918262 /NCGR_PEP_ID=MMETSP1397-20131031/16043_1 /ASSEMBLY_ACC=CAM_ASM_000891 /TAXON_ID=49980 /ORGANISM="Climacostomum Climacostomum virens, Strain Stock W-24" /LENGTH=126 /DNA_ID=CAMNT_0052091509 /DNA_START=168 /DNA_END=548 /DNA_ORIENTATION=+